MSESKDDGAEESVRAWVELRDRSVAPFLVDGLLTVTWASLARHETCPLAFHFDRDHHAASRDDTMIEDAVEDAPALELPKGIDPADFGAFVHAVLEKRRDMGDDLDYTIGRVAARYDFGKHASAMIDLARERINGACAAGLAGASEGARSELPFAVRVGHVLVHGVIDRLDTLKDGTLVTDYKLGAPHDSHHFQVAVYAWAVQRAIGAQGVRARLVYLGFDPIRVDNVETMDARVSAMVEAMGRSFESGEFRSKPGSVCATCEHNSRCPYAAASTEMPGARN